MASPLLPPSLIFEKSTAVPDMAPEPEETQDHDNDRFETLCCRICRERVETSESNFCSVGSGTLELETGSAEDDDDHLESEYLALDNRNMRLMLPLIQRGLWQRTRQVVSA